MTVFGGRSKRVSVISGANIGLTPVIASDSKLPYLFRCRSCSDRGILACDEAHAAGYTSFCASLVSVRKHCGGRNTWE